HGPSIAPISTLSLHDALPISPLTRAGCSGPCCTPELDGTRALTPQRVGQGARRVPGGDDVIDNGDIAPRTAAAGRECPAHVTGRSEEHTSELQSRFDLVCRLL